jgi:predicted lipoprotein with Yx(FWY)xxD motif
MNARRFNLTLVAASALALAACATTGMGGGAPVKLSQGVMTGTNGMTLYTFDRDAAGSGKSVCNDKCAVAWPPLAAESGAAGSGDYSVITRNDGTKQWAYKGKPLYFWVKDQKPGDMTGEGFNKVWRVARP